MKIEQKAQGTGKVFATALSAQQHWNKCNISVGLKTMASQPSPCVLLAPLGSLGLGWVWPGQTRRKLVCNCFHFHLEEGARQKGGSAQTSRPWEHHSETERTSESASWHFPSHELPFLISQPETRNFDYKEGRSLFPFLYCNGFLLIFWGWGVGLLKITPRVLDELGESSLPLGSTPSLLFDFYFKRSFL